MLRTFLPVVLLFIATGLMGQTPRVSAVEPLTSYPFSVLEIKGSGFSNTHSQLEVWFGTVKGTILSSSETSIRVEVPAQARLGSVEVINLSSRRSGRSAKKHMTNFSGRQPFSPTSVTNISYSDPDRIFDLCSCDFDGDGRPDIVGSKFRDGSVNLALLINKSTVAANNTTISFDKATIPLNFPTWSVACGDLNGDGKPELLATRGGNTTGSNVYIFPNTSSSGSISFGAPVVFDLILGDFAREVVVQDMNNDGRPDIIVTNSGSNLLYIFENQLTSASIVSSQFTRHDILAGASTLALDVADLNGDGYPEIIAGRSLSDTRLIILKNPGNGSLVFGGATSLTIAGSNIINDIATADFNGDGRTDIVVADIASGKAFVYLHETELIFKSVNSSTGFSVPFAWGVDVGDMNGDGRADFVISSQNNSAPQVNVFINNGAATPSFTASSIITPKATWFVRVGDFDGDAKPDIAVTSTNNSIFSIDVIKNRNCHLPVILNENPVSVCDGQTVELRAVPMKGVAFTWSTGSIGPTATIGFANTGTITLTAVGEGGTCSVQRTISVVPGAGTAPAKPTVGGPAGVCAGSALTLTTASVAGSPVYTWSGPNNFTAETTVPSVTVSSSATTAQAGNYTVRVRNGDCVSTLSDPKAISVIEPDGFTIVSSAGNTGACTGQAVTLSVNPISGYTYQWKKGTTIINGATSSSLTLSSASAGDAGSYTVAIGHAVFSCSSETAAFTLNVFSAPVASFVTSPQQICVGTQVAFDGSASTLASGVTANYAWEFGNGATGTGITTTHTYTAAQPSLTARLTVSYAGLSSCTSSSTKALSVNAATPPTIAVDPQVTELCANASESVTLSVPGTFTSYLWTTTTNNTGASITIKTPGSYAVATTDANGCPGRAEVSFNPKEGCESSVVPSVDIMPPKVFSPNDDSINDFWVIGGLENYPDCMMNIFDGKGRRVYEAKGSELAAEPWNGRGAGGPVPDGTYYFVFGCPDAKPFTGSVLIVR